MEKIIECELNRKKIIERISALIEGDIKISEYHISGIESCYGKINNNCSFDLYFKQAFFVRIEGCFIDDSNELKVSIYCNYWKYIFIGLLYGMGIVSVILSMYKHLYTLSIMICLAVMFMNLWIIIVEHIILNSYYDALYSLLTRKI